MKLNLDYSSPASIAEKRALLAQLLGRAAEPQPLSLSYGQKALYFLHRSDPESPAYHVAFAARFGSPVDVTALRRALQGLWERHEQLRARFLLRDGEPVQEIGPRAPVTLEQRDATGWSDPRLDSAVREAYRQPFDLSRGPLFRAHLFTRSDQDHVFLITIHHIVYDGWSLWLNQEELATLYAAEVANAPGLLPRQEKSYRDFVRWQEALLSGPEGERLWAYWRERLRGDLPTLNLPVDRPRPPVQSFRGASRRFSLRPEAAERLRSFAQARNVTPFMLYLAAFQVLLHRYSGQTDILVGSPAAGRGRREFANTVGYFVNSLVLRADLSANPDFEAFLEQTKDTVLGALEHQDFPFPLLVEKLQPKRDPSYSPLFQVSFVYQRAQQGNGVLELVTGTGPNARRNIAGLVMEHYDLRQQEGQFDLELEMLEVGQSMIGVFKYNPDLFDDASIDRAVGHFQTLLDGILDNPSLPVGRLPLLPKPELERLTRSFNDTAVEYDLDRALHELIEAQVARTPDAVAVSFEGRELTYRDLNQRSNQLAHYLRARGVAPDSLVAVCMDRSLEMVVALLGILKSGGAYLPLDPALPAERLAFMLEDAGPSFILTRSNCAGVLPPATAIPRLALDARWDELTPMSRVNPERRSGPRHLAYVIYTSGSTGKPKGAMNTHRGICNRLLWMQDAYGLGADDRVLQKTPFTFDVSVWEFFWPLMTGARLVVAKPEGHKDSGYLVDVIVREAITTLHFVPPMLHTFLQEVRVSECIGLRRIICSGEALPLDLQRRCQGLLPADLHNLYGPTEAAVDVTYWACERDTARAAVPIGRPIANTQIHILDPWGQPTPIGVPGELHIGGVNVGRGYLNRPELTEQRFIPDPFSPAAAARLYKTGDLARWRDDGTIDYLGRLDFQVKIRGFRIELGEIEQTLCEYPGVLESVVVTRNAPSGDPCLVAYVTGLAASGEMPAKLNTFLKERLPEYCIPTALVFLDHLPLNHNGKVDRGALPVPAIWNANAERQLLAPRDSTEKTLVRIWESVLGVRPIGIADNFFELGGHSLRAIRIMAEIQAEYGFNLPVSTLFKAPTVEQLAATIRQQREGSPWSPLVPIQPEGESAPFFCVAGGGGSVLYYQPLARDLGTARSFYGLQAKGLDGESRPLDRVEDMAALYLESIRAIQPEGPYLLGGHCFGAIVAFELAQQLLRQGQEVALLAVLDVPAPFAGNAKLFHDVDDATWILQLGRLLEQVSGQDLAISHGELRALDSDGQLDYLRERMLRAGFLPPQAGVAPVRGLVQVFKANNRAHYVPEQPVPVPIALLRAEKFHPDYDFRGAEQGDSGAPDATLGWRNYASGPVAVRTVPGDHVTMLVEPNVAGVAAALREVLAEGAARAPR